jgi:hypothetical protein
MFLSHGLFTVKKSNGRLIFNNLGEIHSTRNTATIWCIEQADKQYNWSDFNEIVIYTGDTEFNSNDAGFNSTTYTYSKQNHYTNLVPCYDYHSWPETRLDDYEAYIKDIDAAGMQKYEIDKVGWVGSMSHINRVKLIEIGNANKELLDFTDSINLWYIYNGLGSDGKYGYVKYIPTSELVKKYSILFDIEGEGFSVRTKHLFWSHRPLLLQDRPHKEFFYEYLKEWEHYIPVKRDLSDLVEKAQWCLNNYEAALEIAENAYQFAKKYLTRAGCYEQWNKIITNHIKNPPTNAAHEAMLQRAHAQGQLLVNNTQRINGVIRIAS